MSPSSSAGALSASATRSSNRSNANLKKTKERDDNNDADNLKKKTSNASVTKKATKKGSASNGAGKGKKKKGAATSSATSLESRVKKQRQVDLQTAKQAKENEIEQDEEAKRRESMMKDQMIMEQHPEYAKLLAQLEASKADRLRLIEVYKVNEIQNAQRMFYAQQKQAWDRYHCAKAELRASLVNDIQQRIAKLKEEKELHDRQLKAQQYRNQQLLLQQQRQQQNELDYENWVPPDRLHTIGSFVAGASYDEINRDIALASARPQYHLQQRYAYPYATTHHRANVHTPHLVYSDNESKSASDTAEDEEQPILGSTSAQDTRTAPETAPLPPINTLHSNIQTSMPTATYTNHSTQPYPNQGVIYSNNRSSPYSSHQENAPSPLPSVHHYTYDYNRASSTATTNHHTYNLPTSYHAGIQSPAFHPTTITASTTPAPYGNGEPSVGWRSGERPDWYYRPRTAA